MFLTLFVSFFVTIAFGMLKGAFTKKIWIAIVVFGVAASSILAYVSVASVWTPHPLSDDVHYRQDALGEYEGVLPFAKLSYPLYLRVYHTQFRQETIDGLGIEHGYAYFNVLLAGSKVFGVNGTYEYYYPVMGPMPLSYRIDFFFSLSPEFFSFLIVLFTLFNLVGACLGVILAGALHKKVTFHTGIPEVRNQTMPHQKEAYQR